MSEIKFEIKKIIENYLKYSNITKYQIEKNKIITMKTIKNILENTTNRIAKGTIEKLLKLPNLKIEDRNKIFRILDNIEKNRSSKKNLDISDDLILELLDNIVEKKLFKKLNNKNIDLYFENRKINSFDSTIDSRTLLGKKIWELNDNVFEKWGDIKMLLDITHTKDKNQMKKGLLSVAKNLRTIANKLEEASDSKDLKTDIIVNIKEEQ